MIPSTGGSALADGQKGIRRNGALLINHIATHNRYFPTLTARSSCLSKMYSVNGILETIFYEDYAQYNMTSCLIWYGESYSGKGFHYGDGKMIPYRRRELQLIIF
jgi:hypothetical protein